MNLAQLRIAEAVTNFYDETAALGLCGLKYKVWKAKKPKKSIKNERINDFSAQLNIPLSLSLSSQ